MKKFLFRFLMLSFPLITLSACSQAPDKSSVLSYTEPNGRLESSMAPDQAISGYSESQEPEGPQYQQPTMDVLRGKAQLFPAKYPIRRYPRATVAMVDVRASRGPGYFNMVMLKTTDDIEQVSNYYVQKLQTENWKLVGRYTNPSYSSSRWTRGSEECEIRVSPDMTSANKKYIQLLTGVRASKSINIDS